MRPALTDRKGSAHGRYSAIMPSSADWRSTAALEMMRKKNVETLNNTLATAMKSLQLSTICHILGNMRFDPQLVLCANERHQYILCWRKSLLEQAPVVAPTHLFSVFLGCAGAPIWACSAPAAPEKLALCAGLIPTLQHGFNT